MEYQAIDSNKPDTFKAAFKAAFNLKIFAACLLIKILIEII